MDYVYKPTENPGPLEARDLKEHPEWPETQPARLMGARDADRRQALMLALEAYKPSENPGPKEARMLAEHPDWVEKFPLRLLGAQRSESLRRGTPTPEPPDTKEPT